MHWNIPGAFLHLGGPGWFIWLRYFMLAAVCVGGGWVFSLVVGGEGEEE